MNAAPGRIAAGAVALLWTAAATLAMRLDLPGGADGTASDDSAGLAGSLLVGEAREALAYRAFVAADLYYHRGREHESPAEAITGTFFQKLRDRVSPPVALHRETAGDQREILPWLWITCRLGGTNTDYLLSTAYWLRVTGAPQQADALLAQALLRSPRNAALYLERARDALTMARFERAARLVDAGLRCPQAGLPPGEDATWDALRLYRAFLHERSGDAAAALTVYDTLIAELPARRASLRQRAEALRRGQAPVPSAQACLEAVAHATAHCAHDAAHEGHDDDHDDPDHDNPTEHDPGEP